MFRSLPPDTDPGSVRDAGFWLREILLVFGLNRRLKLNSVSTSWLV